MNGRKLNAAPLKLLKQRLHDIPRRSILSGYVIHTSDRFWIDQFRITMLSVQFVQTDFSFISFIQKTTPNRSRKQQFRGLVLPSKVTSTELHQSALWRISDEIVIDLELYQRVLRQRNELLLQPDQRSVVTQIAPERLVREPVDILGRIRQLLLDTLGRVVSVVTVAAAGRLEELPQYGFLDSGGIVPSDQIVQNTSGESRVDGLAQFRAGQEALDAGFVQLVVVGTIPGGVFEALVRVDVAGTGSDADREKN